MTDELAARRARKQKRTETPPTVRTTPNGPTATQIKEWLVEMTELDTAGARVRQKVGTLKKNVENCGGDYRAFKALFKATKLSENEATEHLETLVQYHATINIHVSFDDRGQGAFVDILGGGDVPESSSEPKKKLSGTRDLEAARALGDGFNSGAHGKMPGDNPFKPGTETYVEWEKGRAEGQKGRVDGDPDLKARIDRAATVQLVKDVAEEVGARVFDPDF